MSVMRSHGAALAGLFGSRPKRPRQDYATIAEVPSNSDELKPLGEILAGALGVAGDRAAPQDGGNE